MPTFKVCAKAIINVISTKADSGRDGTLISLAIVEDLKMSVKRGGQLIEMAIKECLWPFCDDFWT